MPFSFKRIVAFTPPFVITLFLLLYLKNKYAKHMINIIAGIVLKYRTYDDDGNVIIYTNSKKTAKKGEVYIG